MKYALFIPTRDDTTAADVAELFFEKVETVWGTPKSVVSDRDSRITSRFWAEICELKMLRRRLSTAFHPQTDGQSEALNRIVEDYLRAYTAEEPVSWAKLLPLAQFADNNSHIAPIKTTQLRAVRQVMRDTITCYGQQVPEGDTSGKGHGGT